MINPNNVVALESPGEIVALCRSCHTLIMLTGAAVPVWKRLRDGIGATIIEDLPVDTAYTPERAKSLTSLIETLSRHDIISLCAGSGPADVEDSIEWFDDPHLARGDIECAEFSDLQSLLALHPVTDFSDMGWPYRN